MPLSARIRLGIILAIISYAIMGYMQLLHLLASGPESYPYWVLFITSIIVFGFSTYFLAIQMKRTDDIAIRLKAAYDAYFSIISNRLEERKEQFKLSADQMKKIAERNRGQYRMLLQSLEKARKEKEILFKRIEQRTKADLMLGDFIELMLVSIFGKTKAHLRAHIWCKSGTPPSWRLVCCTGNSLPSERNIEFSDGSWLDICYLNENKPKGEDILLDRDELGEEGLCKELRIDRKKLDSIATNLRQILLCPLKEMTSKDREKIINLRIGFTLISNTALLRPFHVDEYSKDYDPDTCPLFFLGAEQDEKEELVKEAIKSILGWAQEIAEIAKDQLLK